MKMVYMFFPMVYFILISGCSLPTKDRLQTPYSPKNIMLDEKVDKEGHLTYLQDKGIIFVESYNLAKKDESNINLRKFIGTGITYNNLLCGEFFSKLGYTKANRDFSQKTLSLANGLTSALLGLAKTKASTISATGAIFGFGQSTFNNYNDSFIASVDIESMRSLVREKQKSVEISIYEKLDEKKWPKGIETLDQAERELDDYIYVCTALGIKKELRDSVNKMQEKITNENINKINSIK